MGCLFWCKVPSYRGQWIYKVQGGKFTAPKGGSWHEELLVQLWAVRVKSGTPDQLKLVWHQETLFMKALFHSYSSHKLYERLLLLLPFIYIAEVPRGPTQDHGPAVFWTTQTQRYNLRPRHFQSSEKVIYEEIKVIYKN